MLIKKKAPPPPPLPKLNRSPSTKSTPEAARAQFSYAKSRLHLDGILLHGPAEAARLALGDAEKAEKRGFVALAGRLKQVGAALLRDPKLFRPGGETVARRDKAVEPCAVPGPRFGVEASIEVVRGYVRELKEWADRGPTVDRREGDGSIDLDELASTSAISSSDIEVDGLESEGVDRSIPGPGKHAITRSDHRGEAPLKASKSPPARSNMHPRPSRRKKLQATARHMQPLQSKPNSSSVVQTDPRTKPEKKEAKISRNLKLASTFNETKSSRAIFEELGVNLQRVNEPAPAISGKTGGPSSNGQFKRKDGQSLMMLPAKRAKIMR